MLTIEPAPIATVRTGTASFATFWAGRAMPALDRACLASFVACGYPVTVYSFEPVEGLPRGVALGDASTIVRRETLDAFLYNGMPNLSHFSDYFRYCLFAHTPHAWIDTDMMLLRPITVDLAGDVFAKETPRGICGAIMRIGAGAHLTTLVRRTEQLMGTDLVWGATGPRLLNQVMGKATVLERAHPARWFFPIHYDAFWKPFLPAYREDCEACCAEAFTLHLWNNIVVSLGVWKDVAPPAGSYLHAQLAQQGSLPLFRDTYPEPVMQAMVTNWLLRKSGGDIGVLKLLRQAVPSVRRTVGPRLRALRQMRG